jgi:flagellum-specific peptidoglycan hydrolase FlgJ
MRYLVIVIALLLMPVAVDAKIKVRIRKAAPTVKMTPTPTKAQGVREVTWEDQKLAIVKVARKYDIHPSVLVAMTALESARGSSYYCRMRNNCWGIGAYDSDPDQAFHFKSYEAGAEYLARLLSKGRYSKAYAVRHDPYKMIVEIKRAGYATSPTYVEKVTSLPEWHDYMY